MQALKTWGFVSSGQVNIRVMQEKHSCCASRQRVVSQLMAVGDVAVPAMSTGVPIAAPVLALPAWGPLGCCRWHHKSEDFHRDLTKLAGEMQPQTNYK